MEGNAFYSCAILGSTLDTYFCVSSLRFWHISVLSAQLGPSVVHAHASVHG